MATKREVARIQSFDIERGEHPVTCIEVWFCTDRSKLCLVGPVIERFVDGVMSAVGARRVYL